MQISTHDLDPVARAKVDPEIPVFPTSHRLPFALVTALFFFWGMSNNLTDPLIQHLKKAFELTPLKAQLVQTAVRLQDGHCHGTVPVWQRHAALLAGRHHRSIRAVSGSTVHHRMRLRHP